MRLVVHSLLCIALAGCAAPQDHVVFVTRTALGIDVESTPPSASIAYDRVEGYIGPRYDNGTVPPVAGSFATNGKLLDRQVKQVYATGNAAKTVTGTGGGKPVEDYTGPYKTMFFGTSTVLGIKFAFAPTGAAESFTLGFKRKELSVIPVANGSFPSVLATLDTDVQGASQTQASLKIGQYFATGVAADNLAAQQDIQNAFIARAKSALAQYRDDERMQSRFALNTLFCLAKMSDNELPRVWSNAEALALFDDKTIPAQLRAASPRTARVLYTRELSILNAKSSEHTALMRGHQAYVCELGSSGGANP